MTHLSATPQNLDAAVLEALAQPTFPAAFQVTAAANADRPALRHFGAPESEAITFAEAATRIERIAGGLTALGVRRGDSVGLMLDSRNEFHLADLAALHLGAIPYSIYNSNPPDRVIPLLENSGSTLVIAEAHYVPVLMECMARRPELLTTIITVGDSRGESHLTLAELEATPPPTGFDYEARWRSIQADDFAMLLYTSGTTGEPKGVEWTHEAQMQNLRGFHQLIPFSPAGRIVSYLPMAHLAERFMSHMGLIAFGLTVTSAPADRLADALCEVRPTRFFGVPRIYEKLLEPARALAGDPAAARDALGLDQAEYLGSSAAPARADILAFFSGIGLPLVENWGMSETGLTVINPPGAIREGTVGKPTPGVETRLAEDGELLIRGPIFTRYRRDPRRTLEAFDAEGWLHTGDVASIDEDGYHKIIDRKKDLIINSAGKNMAPVYIESIVKQHTPLASFVAAIGDGRKYVTALIALDEANLAIFAAEHGLSGDFAELSRAPEVQAAVLASVAAANEHLARVEQLKTFFIVPEPWVPGSDLVTNSMKVRRRAVNAKYAVEIEALYAE